MKRTPALGFIFITLLIDVTGWGIIIPVMPHLIQEVTGALLSDASRYGGWLISAYAIMQFICAPLVAPSATGSAAGRCCSPRCFAMGLTT